MRTKIIFLLVCFLTNWNLMAQPFAKNVSISCAESDAVIYANGKEMGKGTASVVVPKNSTLVLEAKKTGFLDYKTYFYNMKNQPKPPATFHIIMQKDDSYDASATSDIANVDVEIKTSKSEEEAWKLLSIIVQDKFDIIEVTDKNTGYLRTAWIVQNFDQNTVRTKLIIKLSATSPLIYKVKLLSEYSGKPNTSIKKDEDFKQWDRVLRKYTDIISEMQTRLK